MTSSQLFFSQKTLYDLESEKKELHVTAAIPFHTPYRMFPTGNACEESVSTTPRSLSGRTWLP